MALEDTSSDVIDTGKVEKFTSKGCCAREVAFRTWAANVWQALRLLKVPR